MEILMAVLVGTLFAGGVYGILRRNMMRMIVGLVLLSQSVNLLVFFSGGIVRGSPVITDEAASGSYADPLPQALVLTAIVIGFGLTAFVIILFRRIFTEFGHDDSEKFFKTDT